MEHLLLNKLFLLFLFLKKVNLQLLNLIFYLFLILLRHLFCRIYRLK